MTALTENDLKRLEDLIINGQKAIESRLTVIENSLGEIKADVRDTQKDVKSLQIEQARLIEKVEGIENRLKAIEGTIGKIPDLAEKVEPLRSWRFPARRKWRGELKNWRLIAFLILGAIAGWFVRNSMGNNP